MCMYACVHVRVHVRVYVRVRVNVCVRACVCGMCMCMCLCLLGPSRGHLLSLRRRARRRAPDERRRAREDGHRRVISPPARGSLGSPSESLRRTETACIPSNETRRLREETPSMYHVLFPKMQSARREESGRAARNERRRRRTSPPPPPSRARASPSTRSSTHDRIHVTRNTHARSTHI